MSRACGGKRSSATRRSVRFQPPGLTTASCGSCPNTVAGRPVCHRTCRSCPGWSVFGGAGGRSNEGRLQVDGISVGSAFNGAGVSPYIADVGNARGNHDDHVGRARRSRGRRAGDEHRAEGGRQRRQGQRVRRGREPRDGRRQLHAGIRDAGLTRPASSRSCGTSTSVSAGRSSGIASGTSRPRDEGHHRSVPGMFANENAGDPTKWTYGPDTSQPAVNAA